MNSWLDYSVKSLLPRESPDSNQTSGSAAPSQSIQPLPYHAFPEKEPAPGCFLPGQLCHSVAKKEEPQHLPAEVPVSTPFRHPPWTLFSRDQPRPTLSRKENPAYFLVVFIRVHLQSADIHFTPAARHNVREPSAAAAHAPQALPRSLGKEKSAACHGERRASAQL